MDNSQAMTGFKQVNRGIAETGKASEGAAKQHGAWVKQLKYGAALLGGVVVSGMWKGAQAASDLNETINKGNVIFGSNAKEIMSWASNSARAMGLSRQEAIESAATFGDMFRQLGLGPPIATNMSKQMVQLASDLASFNNADITDVLTAQQAAFRGEYDSLQRFIPNISAARVQQEALRETHKKSAKDLTAANKAQAVANIMMMDGKRAVGDFARTSGGAANQQRILAAQVKDISANFGQLLLPALVVGSRALTTIAGLADRNRGAFLVLGGAIAATAGFVLAMSAAEKIHLAVTTAVKVATAAWAAAQWLLNAAMTANPISLVIVGIAALAAGVIYAYKHSQTFRNIVQGAFQAVRTAAANMVTGTLTVLRFLLNSWLTVAGGILHGAAIAFGWVPGLGPKLRQADAWFQGFKSSVLGKLDDIRRAADITIRGHDEVTPILQRIRSEVAATGGSVTARLIRGGAYQHGTMSVPATGPALLHKSEIVVSPAWSELIRSGRAILGAGGPMPSPAFAVAGGSGGAIVVNVNLGGITGAITADQRSSMVAIAEEVGDHVGQAVLRALRKRGSQR